MAEAEQALIEVLRECLQAPSTARWARLVGAFQPILAKAIWRQISRSKFQQAELIDDLVQQTFLRLCKDNWRALREFQSNTDGQLAAYLRAIATNIALDYLRKPRLSEAGMDYDLPSPQQCPDHALVIGAIEKHLEKCAEKNLARDTEVFWLHYRSGMSAAAIAGIAEFELSAKGVESLLLRITRCLRMALIPKLPAGISLLGPSMKKGVANEAS